MQNGLVVQNSHRLGTIDLPELCEVALGLDFHFHQALFHFPHVVFVRESFYSFELSEKALEKLWCNLMVHCVLGILAEFGICLLTLLHGMFV